MQIHATTGDTRPLEAAPLENALRALGPAGREMSLVEVVLLACDVSEDESEVNDVVDALIDRGAARLLPAGADDMLQRRAEPGSRVAA